MVPETRSVCQWEVTIFDKVISELLESQDSSLFEAIHSFSNLKVGISFWIKEVFGQVVLIHDLLGHIASMETLILEDGHH